MKISTHDGCQIDTALTYLFRTKLLQRGIDRCIYRCAGVRPVLVISNADDNPILLLSIPCNFDDSVVQLQPGSGPSVSDSECSVLWYEVEQKNLPRPDVNSHEHMVKEDKGSAFAKVEMDVR